MNSENILEYTANKDLTLASRMLPKALENKDYEALKVAVAMSILDISYASLRRLIKLGLITEPDKVGRELYFSRSILMDDVSKIANGRKIDSSDCLKSSVSLAKIFKKSQTFIWLKFQQGISG